MPLKLYISNLNLWTMSVSSIKVSGMESAGEFKIIPTQPVFQQPLAY